MTFGRLWAEDHEFDGDDQSGSSGHGDLMHDPWLRCDGEQLQLIAADIIDRCEQCHSGTSRKPRRDAVERRRLVLGNLVANLAALIVSQRDASGIAVSTKNNAITRYDRKGFSPEVIAASLLALESLGLIFRHAGIRNRMRTCIQPSGELRTLLATVTPDQIGREQGGETIILRASGQLRGHAKPLVNYADTPETDLLHAEMDRINAGLNDAIITIDGVPAGPIQLTRRFQIASPNAPQTFDGHGRLYGGLWINMPRSERHRIRLQGEKLADLDFTAMFTQFAYLEAGLPLPVGDPYGGLPGLDLHSTDPKLAADQREAIKRGLNAFFFRTGRMERLPSEVKRLLGPEWTATKFAVALRTRHAPIKHLFGTGIGLRFMFIESQILVRTLLDLLDAGIPALPIHDGIMVPRSGQLRALEAMRKASTAVTGWELPVKAKEL